MEYASHTRRGADSGCSLVGKYRGTAHQRGYDYQWRKARVAFLAQHPLCRYCEQQGKIVPATVVDHITPHKGDEVLFWDSENNWQSLCKPCHDSIKAREEQGQFIGCDGEGNPIHAAHHWNR